MVAGVAVLGIDQYLHSILSAESDTMIVAFCLAAVDCILNRRYRWAFWAWWLAALGRRGTDPGAGDGHEQRFAEPALDRLMAPYAEVTAAVFPIPGGREKVFVLDPLRLRSQPARS